MSNDERDRWIRAFNALDAAVNHHRRDTLHAGTTDDADERLWAARDKLLSRLGGPASQKSHCARKSR